jgi:phospholipid-binding lipoprotein MlaA
MLGAALAGCATPPADPGQRATYEQNNDPLEPLNRKTLAFNEFLDHGLLRPIAKAYVFAVPEMGRTGIHNLLDNMKEPTLFFNNALQGEFKRAGITVERFVINTAFGVGGLFDVATQSGIERQPADFGQTLFVWGVGSGPYLILPIFGPSNPRDAIGQGVDSYADPFTILANEHGITMLTTARLVVGGVDDRAQVLEELDNLEKNALDFYAELRSLSQQHRDAELHHGAPPQAAPNLYNDPGQSAPPPTPVPGEKLRSLIWPAPQTASR